MERELHESGDWDICNSCSYLSEYYGDCEATFKGDHPDRGPKDCPILNYVPLPIPPTIWGWKSEVTVTVRDLVGNTTDVVEIHNLITTVAFNMVRDGLYGGVSDLEVKYFALGSDSTAPAIGDTTLGTETFRKIRTSQSKPGNGQSKFTLYIAPGEAIGAIEEFGWFAGAAAGAGADTGIMIARVLYSRVKTALESITIERTDTFVEG